MPGGTINLRTGNGNNAFNLINSLNGPGALFNVDAQFGNGDDTFQLGSGVGFGGIPGTLSGQVDGGGRQTANTFIQNNWTLAPQLTLTNFP